MIFTLKLQSTKNMNDIHIKITENMDTHTKTRKIDNILTKTTKNINDIPTKATRNMADIRTKIKRSMNDTYMKKRSVNTFILKTQGICVTYTPKHQGI